MKKKQRIMSIGFDYANNEMVIRFRRKLPSSGYGVSQLIRLLIKWDDRFGRLMDKK